ncbi:hypothetical protein [Nitrosarchaeum sp.]|uniref:hypothetical protein n=1 Tax=Nitrosarchaeum sp. TaxID=2026886 RepID=UPI00247DD8A1|nr:hypothetical protein [Nitrosarchaeum sp.]MCV0413229.1 hypothetical protein [Nitrosarchaeum sp.]
MKTRPLTIIGVSLLVFGLANVFRYIPISIIFISQPFPFEHLQNVIPTESGTHFEVGYLPIDEAINDPYWLFWSLTLYVGIGIVTFVIWKNTKSVPDDFVSK